MSDHRRHQSVFAALVLALLVWFAAFEQLTAAVWKNPGEPLIGSAAPQWDNAVWINSPPLKLSRLRGNVVLLRFFMDSACPLCRATAPSLNYFYSRYKDRGLIVIGMYTPKPRPTYRSAGQVRAYVQEFGFEFPVALDNDWRTLKKYWLDRVPDPDYTSVSFLIDRKGIIRLVHPGGEYSTKSADKNSRDDFVEIKSAIERLLAEE